MNRNRTFLPFLAFAFVVFVSSFGTSAFAGVTLVGVEITSTETSPTNASPIPLTFTFDDTVENFDQSDITPTNGALSNFVPVSTTVFTVDITPAADGSVEVDIAQGAATRIGNGDESEADSFMIDYDGTAPTPTITTPMDPTNVNPIPITVTFDEDVNGFTLGDVAVGNGTAQNLNPISASEYDFEIVPTANGTVTVDVGASGVTDDAGNDNVAATQLTIEFDDQAPIPTITTPENPTDTNPIPVTVTFNEDVTGFDLGDVMVTNGATQNLNPVSATVYEFEIVPAAFGNVEVDVPGGGVMDGAGNVNAAATQLVIDYQNILPTFTITVVQVGSNLEVTVQFSEDVTGFDAMDVTITNGTLSNFTPVSASNYTFDVVSLTGSPVTIDVADMAAIDEDANPTMAGTSQFELPPAAPPVDTTSLPDLRLGSKSNPKTHDGDDNHRKVTHSQKNIASTGKFFMSFQNDGAATDTFSASSKKNKSFKVSYRAIGGGGNVTSKLVTGRYSLTLDPQEIKKFKATVRPSGRSKSFKDVIRLMSTTSPATDKGIVKLKYKSSSTSGIVPGTVGGDPLP